MKIFKFLFHLMLVTMLTIVTQIGGVVYLLAYFLFRNKRWQRWLFFGTTYLLATFLVVPFIAPIFGRERIPTTDYVKAHFFFTQLANRNYVTPTLNKTLSDISVQMTGIYPGIQIHYLDANFPFWDGFPLLPHLSHNDGKKLDISLIYENNEQQITNLKPSHSGYGVFEEPKFGEYNQIVVCKEKGYWQYDFPKYLSFGSSNKNLSLSSKGTEDLIKIIIAQAAVSKMFIEPHLRDRMGLRHLKIRYHGCRAVRHDDHIHLQVK